MPIPDFQSLMRPVLDVLSDGSAWTTRALRDELAHRMDVSDEERLEVTTSGSRVFGGRANWAITYLYQARCLSRPERGVVEITERGRDLLATGPHRITIKVLRQFDEFQEFASRANATGRKGSDLVEPLATTGMGDGVDPEEQVDQAIRAIEAAVAAELLERVKAQPPVFLERLILDLMVKMNYGATIDSARHIGGSGDEGFDGVIDQDALGLERVYLQAKRYTDITVGRPAIQAFAGALQGAGATRGVFITTSKFSADARDFANRLTARVVLIDGVELSRLLVRYRVGTQLKGAYEVVAVDEDFFDRE